MYFLQCIEVNISDFFLRNFKTALDFHIGWKDEFAPVAKVHMILIILFADCINLPWGAYFDTKFHMSIVDSEQKNCQQNLHYLNIEYISICVRKIFLHLPEIHFYIWRKPGFRHFSCHKATRLHSERQIREIGDEN